MGRERINGTAASKTPCGYAERWTRGKPDQPYGKHPRPQHQHILRPPHHQPRTANGRGLPRVALPIPAFTPLLRSIAVNRQIRHTDSAHLQPVLITSSPTISTGQLTFAISLIFVAGPAPRSVTPLVRMTTGALQPYAPGPSTTSPPSLPHCAIAPVDPASALSRPHMKNSWLFCHAPGAGEAKQQGGL